MLILLSHHRAQAVNLLVVTVLLKLEYSLRYTEHPALAKLVVNTTLSTLFKGH